MFHNEISSLIEEWLDFLLTNNKNINNYINEWIEKRQQLIHTELNNDYFNLYTISSSSLVNDNNTVSNDILELPWFNCKENCLFSKEKIIEILNLKKDFTNLDFLINTLIDNNEIVTEEKNLQNLLFEKIINNFIKNKIYEISLNFNKKIKSIENFKNKYLNDFLNFFYFTLQKEDVEILLNDILNNLFNIKENNYFILFSMLIPFLEITLRNLLYYYFCLNYLKDKQNNSLQNILQHINLKYPRFSDLLQSNELITILGEDILFLLKLCFGSQNTLNLRNITLHGFISTKEFTKEYLIFLILLFCNIGKEMIKFINNLQNLNNNYENNNLQNLLKCRKLNKDLPFGYFVGDKLNVTNESLQRIKLNENFYLNFNNLLLNTNLFLENCNHLIKRSLFTIPNHFNDWIYCFKLYNEIFIEYYKNKDNNIGLKKYKLLSLLFPIFEHSIRRIYVTSNLIPIVNNLNDNSLQNNDIDDSTLQNSLQQNKKLITIKKHFTRMLKVERNRSLIIFDTILSNRSNVFYKVNENLFFKELNENYINFIFDLFYWPFGVRIRTLMAHGFIHWEWIPIEYIDRIMLLSIALMLKYNYCCNNSCINDTCCNVCKGFMFCKEFVDVEYKSCFHPKSILLDEIYNSLQNLKLLEEMQLTKEYQVLYSKILNSSEKDKINVKLKEWLQYRKNEIYNEYCNDELDDKVDFEMNSDWMKSIVKFRKVFSVEDISDKEFRTLLLCKRIVKEINSIYLHIYETINTKCKKLNNMTKNQLNNFLQFIEFLPILEQVLNYNLFLMIKTINQQKFINENLISSCDRFISQLQSTLLKNIWQKGFELICGFILTYDEILELNYNLQFIKGKHLFKLLYHDVKSIFI
ncbi:hypothetical protein ABK040_000201 [Willaertia magna]